MENRMHLSDKDKYEVNLLWNTFYLMRDHFSYSELEEIVELGNDLIQDKKVLHHKNHFYHLILQ